MPKKHLLGVLVIISCLSLIFIPGCSDDTTITETDPPETNTAPSLASIGAQSTYANLELTFETSATDSASDTLTMTAVNLPSGATYTDNDDGTADFAWTPDTSQIGVDTVIFITSDGTLADSETVIITIEESVQLSGYSDLVEEIAPPPFASGGALGKLFFDPAIMDSIWKYGEHALLGKVFGDSACQEPFALYRNMMELDESIDQINWGLEVGEDTVECDGPEGNMNAVIEIEELTSPVAIPEECQSVIGFQTIDLDYHLSFSILEFDGMQLDAGFKSTDSVETVLFFFSSTNEEEGQWYGFTESNLFWATRNLITDAIQIRCIFFKGLDDDKVMWAYEIKTVGTSDFQYKLTWYSNEVGVEEGFIGRIIGGGNNEVKFILRYQDFMISDTLDANRDIIQMFTGDYADAGADTIGYAQYIDESDYYTYDDLPTALIDNPMDVADLINPWGP